jgi:CRP/FNR family cyclic AMP-dependent transcriptional regulator
VLPLVERTSYRRRLSLWQAAGLRVNAPPLEALIGTLIGTSSESKYSLWMRMCAIHAAGMLGMKSCVPALEELSSAADSGLSQSSQWSLAHLRSGNSDQGAADMLSLVEKVLILKSANLFSETPDNVLADIAGLAQEILADQDQIIFNKGDAGDSLYIIVTGAVRVLDGSRVLNKLGEGDIFGELALLDPEPRVATVKAVEATHLLRLDESHFRVILAERPEVSTAIIRVITRYLRSLLRGAGDFDPNLTASGSHRPLQRAAEAST